MACMRYGKYETQLLFYIPVKPRIMDRDSLKPVRIKVGQNFTIPVSYVGEPAPECIWTIKGMVRLIHFVLEYIFSVDQIQPQVL